MILWDSSLNPEYYSSLHSMYHICLVVRFVLPDMLYIAFSYLLGNCYERTDTLRARTAYLRIIAHCFTCCFFVLSISTTLTFTPHMRLSFSITVSYRSSFHYFD